MTRCSACGRKLRRSRIDRWAVDWLNHRRDCRRYGQGPDA